MCKDFCVAVVIFFHLIQNLIAMRQVDIVVDLINKQDIVVDSSEISKTGAQQGLPMYLD